MLPDKVRNLMSAEAVADKKEVTEPEKEDLGLFGSIRRKWRVLNDGIQEGAIDLTSYIVAGVPALVDNAPNLIGKRSISEQITGTDWKPVEGFGGWYRGMHNENQEFLYGKEIKPETTGEEVLSFTGSMLLPGGGGASAVSKVPAAGSILTKVAPKLSGAVEKAVAAGWLSKKFAGKTLKALAPFEMAARKTIDKTCGVASNFVPLVGKKPLKAAVYTGGALAADQVVTGGAVRAEAVNTTHDFVDSHVVPQEEGNLLRRAFELVFSDERDGGIFEPEDGGNKTREQKLEEKNGNRNLVISSIVKAGVALLGMLGFSKIMSPDKGSLSFKMMATVSTAVAAAIALPEGTLTKAWKGIKKAVTPGPVSNNQIALNAAGGSGPSGPS